MGFATLNPSYALEGGSGDGRRTYVISETSDLRIESASFAQPRPEYVRDDGAFAEILAQL